MPKIASQDADVGGPIRARVERSGVSQSRLAGLANISARRLYLNELDSAELESVSRVLDAIDAGEIERFPRRGRRAVAEGVPA